MHCEYNVFTYGFHFRQVEILDTHALPQPTSNRSAIQPGCTHAIPRFAFRTLLPDQQPQTRARYGQILEHIRHANRRGTGDVAGRNCMVADGSQKTVA